MNQPQRLPPQLEAEIRRRIAAGQPLPPGIKAVPAGGGMPLQHPAMQARETVNPIPGGAQGLQVLRQMSECNIPKESQTISDMLKTLATETNHDDQEEIEKVIASGLATAVRANYYCNENLKTRVAVQFAADDKLKALNEELNVLDVEREQLQTRLQEIVGKAQGLLKERWTHSVKTYGLAPDKFFYWISEKDGTIEEVELKCHECKGATKIRKARQEIEELIARLRSGVKEE